MYRLPPLVLTLLVLAVLLAACAGIEPSSPSLSYGSAPEIAWQVGYGTQGSEKVQRGFEASDGSVVAIGNTGEESLMDPPEAGASLTVSDMNRDPSLLYGEYVTAVQITLDGDVVAKVEFSEDLYWEEYVFYEVDLDSGIGDFGYFREDYAGGFEIENWEDTYAIDVESGTVSFDYTDNQGKLIEKTLQYGSETDPDTGESTVFLQDDEMVYILPAGGATSPVTDILVMEIDKKHRINWKHIIGTQGMYDVGYACLEVEDGYIIAGGRYVDEDHPQERWIAKIDKLRGLPIWEKTYPSTLTGYGGEEQADAIHDIIVGPSGDLVAAGYVGGEQLGFAFDQWAGYATLMVIDPDDGELITEYIDIDKNREEKLPTLMFGASVVAADGGYYIGGDHGMIPSDEMAAAISFYTLDGNALSREFTTYFPELSIIDMTKGHGGGVVVAGHHKTADTVWAPHKIVISKLEQQLAPTPGAEMAIVWSAEYYNPREFPTVDGKEYIRDEVWEIITVYAADGYPENGYAFGAGDGDETGDVDEISPVDGSSSSIWHCYAGYLSKDGEKIWDRTYHLKKPRDDFGHEACEAITTTADGGFILFSDSDNATDFPNDFGFIKIGGSDG